MFGNLFKKKKATEQDVFEVLKLMSFGTAFSIASGFSSDEYSLEDSLKFETIFALFLSREILTSEMLLLARSVERVLKNDKLTVDKKAFVEGHQIALSGSGFVPYVEQLAAERSGYRAGIVKDAVTPLVELVQQVFNDEQEIFIQASKILSQVPASPSSDLWARIVDDAGEIFVPSYVQILNDVAIKQGRHDWMVLQDFYPRAKVTVLEGIVSAN